MKIAVAIGDPNGIGRQQWQTFNEATQLTMEFGDTVGMRPVSHRARLEFWDDFYASQRGEKRVAA